jgi:predicted peroxiredoxin
MKKAILFLMAALFAVSCNQRREQPTSTKDTTTPARDGIFIHITEGYNDPHKVLMPLKMANLMTEDKDVIVYMDIKAVELLVKGAADIKSPEFDSYQEYIRQLLEKNVGIYACPTCLSVAGYKPEDLMEGIQIAMKDKFFSFTEGRILTMNY